MAQSAAQRMKAYRHRLKAAGLRPVRILVPDTRSRRFKAEIQRQSLLVTGSLSAQKEMDVVEALQADTLDPWDR